MTELEALFEIVVPNPKGLGLVLTSIERGPQPQHPDDEYLGIISELAAKVSAGLLEAGKPALAQFTETEVRISPRTVRVEMWNVNYHHGAPEDVVTCPLPLKHDRHLRDVVLRLFRFNAKQIMAADIERERREALAAMAEERMDRRVKELMSR